MNVKRKIFPSARCRNYFFGIQPKCLNVHSRIESGLAQACCPASFPWGKRSNVSFPLWFHFTVVAAPFVFWKRTSTMVIHLRSVVTHGPIGDSQPTAFFGYPRVHRVIPETRCLKHTGPNVFIDAHPRTERLKNPTGQPPWINPRGWERTL